ncbi:complex I subunit 1/NuoH family protein [Marinigracilibium pacificum]|uniref:NADH-quinone oxidoreductase subunit H n=1 Tax=Marinigracilibium pacificum TaxID=2729599 RepID=A0A848J374_9BACT|nr:complex I subunit 1 family protein [Marinigracilibium pacificum]NMM48980.1 NADH-quinone oxidoreductase subunit H [Marinigracilibium pacificum]
MISFLFFLGFLVLYGLIAIYAERKISAFIQDRYGPMEVGYKGLLQTFADILKLLQKENIFTVAADKPLFAMAPIIIFVAMFAAFAVIPLSVNITGSEVATGVYYALAIVSLDILGILMAGWGSNNKYAIIGAYRSVAQIVSYEIPLGLSVLGAIMLCGTLDLQEISLQQSIHHELATKNADSYLLGLKFLGINLNNYGGFLTWNIFRMPPLIIGLVIFFITSLAESNRAPFDLPEAESELIAGFHTEYSGFRFAVIMLAEYGVMLLTSFLAVVLFLGSWNTPLPNIGFLKLANWTSGTPGSISADIWGIFWLCLKAMTLVMIQIWIRWTFPRLRVDQLMNLGWKYLTPAALIVIFIVGLWKLALI